MHSIIILKKILHKFKSYQVYLHKTLILILINHFFKQQKQLKSNETHLKAAMNWLHLSQIKGESGGSAGSYCFGKGWAPPYPETTGYIIPTFIKYAKRTINESWLKDAVLMGDWEISIQLPTGAVRGGMGVNNYPIVFNTGQVMLGWIELFIATKDEKYLNAAKRAGDWLILIQDDDGKWSKHTYNNKPHAYHSRVAWPLLYLGEISADNKYKLAGENNIRWVMSQSLANGWFMESSFNRGQPALTHTIAYTIRGLLESSFFLDHQLKTDVRSKVFQAAEKLLLKFELNKPGPYNTPLFLSATFDEKWNPKARYSCLTGNAQLAIIWLNIYKLQDDPRYLNAALKIMDQLKSIQILESYNKNIRGAIPGSYPIWGEYFKNCYPNWATKFFADAIMMQEDIMLQLEQ